MHKLTRTTPIVLVLLSLLSCSVFDYISSLGAAGTSTPLPQDTPASQPPTSTPAPTGLNPTGPHVVFEGSGGIWISNPDGSYPTRITEDELNGSDLRRAISPAGDHLALVVKNDQGLDLVLVKIPGGETKTIAHLNELYTNPVSPKAFASYAIADYNSLAWSPGDGSLLAFIGAINGPTADLYMYDTQTEKITQLTNGPSQAIYPNWSPDGGYILHYGVSWTPPFGGAIVGYNRLDGVWAVQVSDGKVITQPKPTGNHDHFVGWQDDSHYLTFDSDDECYAKNLRSVDIVTGALTPIMDFSFYYPIAQSPENKSILFSGDAGCPTSPGEGVFILFPGQTTPTRLLDKKAYEINWLPESSVFQAYPEALFSSDGSTRYDPPVYDKSFNPAISKNGYQAWEVIENQQGRVELKVPGADWREIMKGSVAKMIWDPMAGNILLIALQNGELYAASFPDFTPRLMGNLDGRVNQAIWLP
jgi:hypothetical protein